MKFSSFFGSLDDLGFLETYQSEGDLCPVALE